MSDSGYYSDEYYCPDAIEESCSDEESFESQAVDSAPKKLRIDKHEMSCKYWTEDRHFMFRGDNYDVVGVLDGHSGHEIAELAVNFLPEAIENRLKKFEDIDSACNEDSEVIPNLMKDAFLETDAHIRNACVENHGICHKGSCVLVALITNEMIWVANAGDSGALLISENKKPEWLSEFHNAGSCTEYLRLKRTFPDEPDIVDIVERNFKSNLCPYVPYRKDHIGYLKGILQPTRSLGDFFLKDKDLAYANPENHYFQKALENFHPPYVSGVPEVKSRKRDDQIMYLIVATDGLWDRICPLKALESINSNSSNLAASMLKGRISPYARDYDDIASYVVEFKKKRTLKL